VSERTAVYRLYDSNDVLLYIGVASIFGTRWHQHAGMQPWWPHVDHQTIEWHATREDAEAAGAEAIRQEKPVYNCLHNGKRRFGPRRDPHSGFPADGHPLLLDIREARAEYDLLQADADADAAHRELMTRIGKALDEAEALPEGERRKLGPSAIGRAANFTREYISKIRDGRAR
jgi:hypothetical protein